MPATLSLPHAVRNSRHLNSQQEPCAHDLTHRLSQAHQTNSQAGNRPRPSPVAATPVVASEVTTIVATIINSVAAIILQTAQHAAREQLEWRLPKAQANMQQ